MAESSHITAAPVVQSLSLIPVGLKEAALDSPSFRATVLHISDQVDVLEKWLDSYARSAAKLTQEATSLENSVNAFLSSAAPSVQLSEAILDHDYALLAMKRYGQGARDYWNSTIRALKRLDVHVIDPIRAFLQREVRIFKDARRSIEQTQKAYESIIIRYMSQAKTKEPSSLREDAFQLYETRKTYLKSSMEFCIVSTQLRASFDKLLVKLFSEQWNEMRASREDPENSFMKWSPEMDRIVHWSKQIEIGEKVFRRELLLARKQIEDAAELSSRPSRELDAYALSAPSYLGAQDIIYENSGQAKSEKQGWLFQRSILGKPARTVWLRRWFFVNNGVFGCLVQGARSGGVEESEKMSVLLCGIRPATQEERRFCFEVKTKNNAIILQAETQAELTEWIAAFNYAKRDALEDPASTNWLSDSTQVGDASFSMNAPAPLELSGDNFESQISTNTAEFANTERAATLPIPDIGSNAYRGSFDLSSKRRINGPDKDAESGRDHAARIIQKLDLNRKSTAGSQLVGAASPHITAAAFSTLPSASNALLGIQTDLQFSLYGDSKNWMSSAPIGALAPQTLINPPAPTNLSRMAVIASRERGIRLGQNGKIIPSGLMANLWGSTNWCNINRLDSIDSKGIVSLNSSQSTDIDNDNVEDNEIQVFGPSREQFSSSQGLENQQDSAVIQNNGVTNNAANSTTYDEKLPSTYPAILSAQDAQFRVLFPTIPGSQHVVLVFRATWNLPGQQEFPGRIYVTLSDIYFYSHHLGLVLMSAVSLAALSDVKVSKGQDYDFLYLHLSDTSQKDPSGTVIIKLFLEPSRLVQKRLMYLIKNSQSANPDKLEVAIKSLMKMKVEEQAALQSIESQDDMFDSVSYAERVHENNFRAAVKVDGTLLNQAVGDERKSRKLRLPPQPVLYAPPGMRALAVQRDYNISAKALFHVLFGDKSAVFQILYCQRGASYILQSPWYYNSDKHLQRDLEYGRGSSPSKRLTAMSSSPSNACDHQIVDVLNDHLCYVVSYVKFPWHLPRPESFRLRSKIVVTHVSKFQCRLAIYVRVDWFGSSRPWRGLVETVAIRDMQRIALDIVDVVTDQVDKLGKSGGTKKAIQIFGQVGQQVQVSRLSAADVPSPTKKPRFRMRSKPLHRLLTAAILSYMWDALVVIASSIFQTIYACLKLTRLNTILSLVFIISISTNLLTFTNFAKDWWVDRRLTSTMRQLGVHADFPMMRGVYLHDIDKVWSESVTIDHNERSDCFDTFIATTHRTDVNSLHEGPEAHLHNFSAQQTSRRLRQDRKSIAKYRHNLLVSMRLINSLEKEMLQAEWENWLFDENDTCEELIELTSGMDDDISARSHNLSSSGKQLDSWFTGYCNSCAAEKERTMKSYEVNGLA